jgi:hypothetical protein
VSDPEETAPFTHQPYGKDADDNPFVSPSGPAAQPSGPGFVTPPTPPPPTLPYDQPADGQPPYGQPPYGQPAYGQVPYGQVPYGQQAYPTGWMPAYGAPYPGSSSHKGATASLTLGIISIASLLLTPFCCITIPGVLCAPFAWVIGARARREIAARPGVFGNVAAAHTGMWMGIVMTILSVLTIGGLIVLFAWLGTTDYSLV